MMSSAQLSEAKTIPPCGSIPITSGRYPHGSRDAYSVSPTVISTQNAPCSCERASSICASTPCRCERAIRWTITSLSMVLWKMAPSFTRRARSSCALVRLPLCTSARSPSR